MGINRTEPTWDDPGSYSLTLYDPNGNAVKSSDIDLSDYSDSEIRDLRRSLEAYNFRYLGNGAFYNTGDNTFHFLKSGKWLDYSTIKVVNNLKFDWDDWEYFEDIDELTFDKNKYIIDFDKGAILLDANGDVQTIELPETIKNFTNLNGISDNYILLNYYGDVFSPSTYYLYNIQDKELIKYDGTFADHVPVTVWEHGEINNEYFAIDISGYDDKTYVAVISNDTLEGAFDPIYIKNGNAFTLTEDVLVITNDEETQLIDFDGNIVSAFNTDEEEVIYVGQDTVMCTSVGSNRVNYYHYDGTKLFDDYDFSNAIDLSSLID